MTEHDATHGETKRYVPHQDDACGQRGDSEGGRPGGYSVERSGAAAAGLGNQWPAQDAARLAPRNYGMIVINGSPAVTVGGRPTVWLERWMRA